MKIMKTATLAAALGLACMVGLPAMAQTAPSPASGTMTATTATPKPDKNKHKKHEDDHKDSKKHDHDKKKSPSLAASDQFSSLSAAEAHCPSGTVEWATMGGSSHYHDSHSRWFGKTKHGVYACKAALDAAGFSAGK